MKKEIKMTDESTGFLMGENARREETLHFHSDVEVYCVLKGKAMVTIAGERCLLTEGELAIINQFENHCYEIDEDTKILVFDIGVKYLRYFFSLYSNKSLPRWLKDIEFNKSLTEYFEKIYKCATDDISELRKVGDICHIISCIIERYGLMDKKEKTEVDKDLITEVVDYIYEHYNEDITLEYLANRFNMSTSALSKKLSSRIGMDLRRFVNDIRVQNVVQMLDDPENKEKTINEIAFLCGFSSMSTFYRCYKRNYSLHKLDEADI